MAEPITVVSNDKLETGDATYTPGIERRQAPAGGDAQAFIARTASGKVSGWHHHADTVTLGYVISGRIRFEFGPGGKQVVEAGPGDFFRVPPRVVHREGNPSDTEQVLAAFRIGSGPTVVNVDGPD